MRDYSIAYSRAKFQEPIEVSPDEFKFNFMGYSGEFYLNPQGEWQVVSDDNIEVEFDDQTGFNSVAEIRGSLQSKMPPAAKRNSTRYFFAFTLVTPDGSRYTFGNDSNAIEYSVAYRNQVRDFLIPTTWYLTEVTSPRGKKIRFNYEADDPIAFLSAADSYTETSINIGNSPANCNNQSYTYNLPASGQLIFPVYLSRISFALDRNGANPLGTIEFKRSTTTELRYSDYHMEYSSLDGIPSEDFYIYFSDPDELQWKQLDRMIVKNQQGTTVKSVSFNYDNTAIERLQLASVQELGQNNLAKPAYKFEYNAQKLPIYTSRQIDHWGYFNSAALPVRTMTPQYFNDYETLERSPDPTGTAQLAQVLNQVTYPSGGYTTYQFEAHQYGVEVDDDRTNYTTLFNPVVAGGVRIQKIVSNPIDGQSVSKEYYYVKNYNLGDDISTLPSSGVMGSPYKYYWPNYTGNYLDDNSDFTYSRFVTHSLLPYGEAGQGSHVGYSEVLEVEGTLNSQQGYSLYTYSNYDLDYRGEQHPDERAAGFNDPNRLIYSPYTSKAFERGKLLMQRSYNQNGSLLVKQENFYQTQTSFGTYEKIPMVLIETTPVCDFIIWQGTAFYQYAVPYSLVQQDTYHYDQNGSNAVLSQVTTTYNDHNQVSSQTTTDSEGEQHVLAYKYAPDFSNTTYGSDLLRARHMYNPVLLQTKTVNGTLTKKTENFYQKVGNHIVPDHTDVYPKGTGDSIRFDYAFTTAGNIETIKKQNDASTTYLWGYNDLWPVTQALNASPSEIFYTSFENEDGVQIITTDSRTGQQCYQGLFPVLQPSQDKTYLLTWWEKEANLNSSEWSYNQRVMNGTESIGGTGKFVDEVRAFPTGALMTTYTYDPLYGMTSMTDPDGKTTFYQFDDLSRLKTIRNHQERIERDLFYRYHY